MTLPHSFQNWRTQFVSALPEVQVSHAKDTSNLLTIDLSAENINSRGSTWSSDRNPAGRHCMTSWYPTPARHEVTPGTRLVLGDDGFAGHSILWTDANVETCAEN
jgi:hypothetical protein